ncbi:MAG: EpsG family protein [Oscillospiraceae bacterium]|nr:EpsG family protein [Oscillospiraceae bacterium]
MTVYYILMLLILGLAYPLCIKNPSQKKNTLYVCTVFGYMLVMSVLRYGIGNDYFNYRRYLYGMTDNDLTFSQTMDTFGIEPGYVLLMKLTQLLGGDYFILNLITAVLILVPTAYVILRHSKIPWISAWLYLTVTFFYNSLNFTRQSLSVAVIFLGWRFFRDKNHIGAVITVLLASMFHVSALVLIPVYFMSLIKPSAKSLGIIGGGALLCFIFSNQILSFVTTYLLPNYAKYMDTIYLKKGLSPVFLIIPAILLILTLTAYFHGWHSHSSEAPMLTNFIFYNFLIWLFIIKHFIIERFSMPVYIFILLSVPELLEYSKTIRLTEKVKGSHAKPSEQSRLSVYLKNGKRIYPMSAAFIITITFIYNQYCAMDGVHGVFPYRSITMPAGEVTKAKYRDNYRELFVNAEFLEFLGLANGGNYTVLLCVNGGTGDKLELPYQWHLKRLGFETDLTSLDGQSYMGLVSGGKAVFEKTSPDVIEETFSLYGGKLAVSAISGGNTASLQKAGTLIDRKEYMPDSYGLNFAVFDNEQKKIVAAQGYDISDFNYTYHNSSAFYGEILEGAVS